MAKNLVIVESPSKCKSIQTHLNDGSDDNWIVVASFGHVRTLVRKNGSVDVNNNFKMKFETIKNKHNGKDPINEIIKLSKKSDKIWLASDPDREGEAIAYHVQHILKESNITKPIVRITFNEITKRAIKEAIKHPRSINMSLVEAQMARQSLDYLVGFNLSPLLWKKIGSGTSAGRVQSPALRLIDDRDSEINKFEPTEFWSITLLTQSDSINFRAKLINYDDVQIKQFDIPNGKRANELLENMSGKEAKVTSIKRKTVNRKPNPPFTTSTLQQEAARKLGFSGSRTMKAAQVLYETVPSFGKGLITYMRTDSVALSSESIESMREYLIAHYGKDILPNKPIVYTSKSKNAQEAHEAIRPTNVNITPDDLKDKVSDDLYKLYKLIWSRTLASQMNNAVFDSTSVDISVEKGTFRATGSVLVSMGYLSVYEDSKDEDNEKEDSSKLPNLTEGQILPNDDILAEQHYTKPPPKFNDASLVKILEEYGIGRPSTYASIITTLKERGYVNNENKRFSSTDIGHAVNEYLKSNFPEYVDYGFTSDMENKLDEIANGNLDKLSVLQSFWKDFSSLVKQQKDSKDGKRGVLETLDETCPECNKGKLVVKLARYGKFITCECYPDCKYNRKIENEKNKPVILDDKLCPECNSPLVKRKNKKGQEFIGCSKYPECTYIEGRKPPVDTGRLCPICKQNNLVERTTKFGKMISCGGFPNCRYIEKKKK